MAKKAWKVVVVDDDPVVLMILQTVFLREGWSVVTAGNGIDGLRLIREQNPDMVVLDLMLPALNGWEICKILREENTIPILMLTALDQEDHLIKGLQLGADDYLTKPFSPREVLARVQAILRRSQPERFSLKPLQVGALFIDPAKHAAFMDDQVLRLTPAEFRILFHLAQNKETLVTRQKILLLSSCHGELADVMDRTADAHIKNLRRKLAELPESGISIETVRGLGYKLVVG